MTVAILLAGGKGTRIGGDIPKQYLEIEGEPLILYALRVLERSPLIDGIQIIAEKNWQREISVWTKMAGDGAKIWGYSEPGDNRQLSIFNGMEALRDRLNSEDLIFVHDAVRPFLSERMIEESLKAIKGHDGVIPVLPMNDTVYCSKTGKKIDSLLKRSEIYAGQAPETFVFGKYYDANVRLIETGEIEEICGSTEPAILAGMDVQMIPGDEKNFKITTHADLERFKELVKSGRN